jgi:hypothetical protein
MHNHSRSLALVAALVVIPAACKKSDESAGQSTPSAKLATSEPAPSNGVRGGQIRSRLAGRFRGRPERLVSAALEQVPLTEPQVAKLEALEKRLTMINYADDEGRAFRAALAESSKRGTIDAKKFDRYVEAIEHAAKRQQGDAAKVMNELHASLDSAQRKTLASAVRKEQQTAFARKPLPAPEQERIREERAKVQTERLSRELRLNDVQSKQLARVEAKWRDSQPNSDFHAIRIETEKRVDALAQAFEQDSFDAGKLALLTVITESAAKRAAADLERAKALVPILTPEQRVKFGEHLERSLGMPRAAASAYTPAAASTSAD